MPRQAARADVRPHAVDSCSSVVVELAAHRDPSLSPRPPTLVVLRPARRGRIARFIQGLAVVTVVGAVMVIVAAVQHLPGFDPAWLRGEQPVVTAAAPASPAPVMAAAVPAQPEAGQGQSQAQAMEEQSQAPSPAAATGDSEFALAAQIPVPEEVPQPTLEAESATRDSVLHLGKGDTVAGVLGDLDLDRREIARALAVLAPRVSLRRLPVGQEIRVTTRAAPDADSPPTLESLTLRPEARREVLLERLDSGAFRITEKAFEIVKRVVQVAGAIKGSLIASLHATDLPAQALAELLRAFSWDVNFQHDIKLGDRFAALVEQSWTEDGQRIDGGRLLWARLTTGGGTRSFSVYRFKPQDGREFFFNRDGESVVKALLRTPLDLAHVRISSGFGRRLHPLLGFTRMHEGIDFAAPPGTPVLAAGDGKVVQAGRNGGYGNWVEIQHGSGLATGYAHLLRFGPGIRAGSKVHQSQVVGYVGTTGLSTGPHLHFELRRAGVPINPLGVAQQSLRHRLQGRDLARFRQVVAKIDRLVRNEKPAAR